MPRRPRPDYEPEILLPDVRVPLQQASEAIGERYQATVRPADFRLVDDGWTNMFNKLNEVLTFIRRHESHLDEGLLSFMMRNCTKASKVPVLDQHREQILRDGQLVWRVTRVGCRIYLTQSEIADGFGCSRQHVNKQIQIMKKHGLIVNKGRGWHEFDATLCWCGDFKIQRAYLKIQRVRDGIVITDGNSSLVTEDMDDDDYGEHTAPGAEGEEE